MLIKIKTHTGRERTISSEQVQAYLLRDINPTFTHLENVSRAYNTLATMEDAEWEVLRKELDTELPDRGKVLPLSPMDIMHAVYASNPYQVAPELNVFY